MALEIIDNILGQSIGLHLYEPVVTTREKLIVKLSTQHARS